MTKESKEEVMLTMATLMALKELSELQGNKIKVPQQELFDRVDYFYLNLMQGVPVKELEKEFVSRKVKK